MAGYIGQRIEFPQWLGKNSSRGKNDRILQELKIHMAVRLVYSLKSVGIVTECISDHSDTNKRNNRMNLICVKCLKGV